jgi:ADP-heptose:LPS heptosyltransferase
VNLLILRALGLGDLLTAVPAIRAIARAFPMHRRIIAAPAYLKPLVNMCGGVDDLVDASPLEAIRPNVDVDVAVNLHGRGPESHRILLALSPTRLIAFANGEIPETKSFPQWRADEHEIDRWCRMLSESGIMANPSDLELSVPHLDARSRGAIIVHPGAASESRRWPANRWIELCMRLRRGGHRVVLTGSATEFRRCRFIAKATHIPIESVLAGRTDLGELACVIHSARAIVCGDTGVAHIATAVRTPSVILFGPTSPQYWGPPPARPLHRVIWRGTIGNPHAPFVDPGLASITVDEVLAELHRLLHLAQAG